MKKIIPLLALLLLSGCQIFFYEEQPLTQTDISGKTYDISVSASAPTMDRNGFDFPEYLENKKIFAEIVDSEEKPDVLLIAKMELQSGRSPALEYSSQLLMLMALLSTPAYEAYGVDVNFYLIDSQGNLITSYLYEADFSKISGLLVLPIDGIGDMGAASVSGTDFMTELNREAIDHFVQNLRNDSDWTNFLKKYHADQQEAESVLAALSAEQELAGI